MVPVPAELPKRRRVPAFVGMTAILALIGCTASRAEPSRQLRVCADPNNLPFSNERGEGIENRLAELVAAEMNAELTYSWVAQRRGFVRTTLNADVCDMVMGVPSSFGLVLSTAPYYRSSYVFVYREDSGLEISSFDDPRLRDLRVGVQLVGDDGVNTPPVHALSKRGIVGNVVGYTLYGDYSQPNPPARIVEAVAGGEIDVGIVWGPLAGYFASRAPVPLAVVPVTPQIDLPFLPFVFDIAVGVERGDTLLRDEVQGILDSRRAAVDSLLAAYHIPRLDRRTPALASSEVGG